MLTGKDRQDWIEEQFRKYRKRNSIGWILIFVGGGSLAAGLLFVPSANLPPDIRQPLQSALLILSLVFVFGSSPVSNSARKFLPPVEDRALYWLKSASINLKAYANHGHEAYKDKAVKDLTKAADVLDSWTWGNLQFVRESVGKAVDEFKKNFRGRLIPAIKGADRNGVQSFFLSLTGFENTFEFNQLDQAHVEAWNKDWLAQYPYHTPRPGILKRVSSRRLDLGFMISALVAPAIIYYLAVSVPLASRDTAFSGSIVVFGIVVTAYVSYLRLGRQKGSQ